MRVSILGTGIMGAPMARNLAEAGHEVRVWNRSREKAEATGLPVAGTPREAVEGAEVVVTMLADGDAVQEVVEQAIEAVEGVLCQMSTIGIAGTEAVAALCERAGVPLVDAPVLGTRQPAEQGALVVLASGPDAAIERCQPVFEAVGAKVVPCGEAGGGTRLKLVLNHWLLGLVDALAETLDLAEAIDVEPAAFLDTIRGGPLGLPYADLKGKLMIEGAYDPPAFPLALAGKDARLVLEAAERHDLALEHLPVTRERAERAVELAGAGDLDIAAIRLAGGRRP